MSTQYSIPAPVTVQPSPPTISTWPALAEGTPPALSLPEPDPTGYECPECQSSHPARGASNKYFGARRCSWCRIWTKRMEKAFTAAWMGHMAEAMVSIRRLPWAEQNAARHEAQEAAGDAAKAARLDVLIAAIVACAEARQEMAGAA